MMAVADDIGVEQLIENNRKWAEVRVDEDANYFQRTAEAQCPKFLWIGCADSRAMPEPATGVRPGEMFVHRNVGNIVSHADSNAMSCLEYPIKVLGVNDVLVVGHTNCGAVRAALTLPSSSPLLTNCWLASLRATRNAHAAELSALPPAAAAARLVELNVVQQCVNVATSPVLQQVWAEGRAVCVHGLVYDVSTGRLRRLVGPITSADAGEAPVAAVRGSTDLTAAIAQFASAVLAPGAVAGTVRALRKITSNGSLSVALSGGQEGLLGDGAPHRAPAVARSELPRCACGAGTGAAVAGEPVDGGADADGVAHGAGGEGEEGVSPCGSVDSSGTTGAAALALQGSRDLQLGVSEHFVPALHALIRAAADARVATGGVGQADELTLRAVKQLQEHLSFERAAGRE